MGDMKNKCQKLEEEQHASKKKVNPKVLTMIDRCVPSSLSSPPSLR
jgi:hypothetical protein